MFHSVLINHYWATHKHTQVFVLKYWFTLSDCCPHMPNTGPKRHDHANTKNTQAILNLSRILKQWVSIVSGHFKALPVFESTLTQCTDKPLWARLWETRLPKNWSKNVLSWPKTDKKQVLTVRKYTQGLKQKRTFDGADVYPDTQRFVPFLS